MKGREPTWSGRSGDPSILFRNDLEMFRVGLFRILHELIDVVRWGSWAAADLSDQGFGTEV